MIRLRSSTAAQLPAALGSAQQLSPTYATLMDALAYREDQIIDTRETLETIFNGLQSGVAMISTELQIVLVNQFFHTLLSAHTEDDGLVGKPCLRLNLASQSPTVETLCANTLLLKNRDFAVPTVDALKPILLRDSGSLSVLSQVHDQRDIRVTTQLFSAAVA